MMQITNFILVRKPPTTEWLAKVGAEGWIVFSHDKKFHNELPVCAAIKQHNMGCFYLWGANAETWDKLHCFIRASRHIMMIAEQTPKPFIFHVAHNYQNCTDSDTVNAIDDKAELQLSVEHMHHLQGPPSAVCARQGAAWRRDGIGKALFTSSTSPAIPRRPEPMPGHRRSRGSDKRRFFAVLHQGPVTSPIEAVRAAIVQEFRANG